KLRGSQVAPGCLATSCPIDNQPLQIYPILQLDDMSFILGLPRGFKHSEPPGVPRNVTSYQFGCGCADRAAHAVGLLFRKRAAACARESATALPWAHCSAFPRTCRAKSIQ